MTDKENMFYTLLTSTKRTGIQQLYNELKDNGFFTAPCSGSFHLAKDGGLLEHSLNVCKQAQELAMLLLSDEEIEMMKNSIIICSLLHDVGKCGQFGKPYYVPNVLKSGSVSSAKPFVHNSDTLPFSHAESSVMTIVKHMPLTEDEAFAIRYHDGMYEYANKALSGKETKLQCIIHWADMWCSRFTEE